MLFQRVQISYIFPQSFPSVPNIQFSDNISAPDIVNRHTSRLKGFIYEKFKLHVHIPISYLFQGRRDFCYHFNTLRKTFER